MGELVQFYKEGIKNFAEGNLNSAFNYLSMAVTEGLEIEESNNALALILMYRGEFEQAYRFFMINNKKFSNKLSEKYLLEIDKVNNFIKMHNDMVDLVKQCRYDEALSVLLFLREKGFRTVNDDILICLIYHLKKEHKKCRQILSEIYEMNKEELFYYEMKSYLDRKSSSKTKLSIVSLAAIAIIFSSITISTISTSNSYKAAQTNIAAKPVVNKTEKSADSQYKLLVKLSDDIMKEDLYDFAQNDKKLDISALDEQSRAIYSKLKENYNTKAEMYFYKNGLDFYKNGAYKKAYEYLSIAYDNMKNNYLDEHVIFFTSKAAKASGNQSINYYKEYVKKYSKGTYIEECLYDLAILSYENKNMKEAKKYASILAYEYTTSIYNNDKIKLIIDKN